MLSGLQGQDSKGRTPRAGLQGQDSKGRTPRAGLQGQDSKGLLPLSPVDTDARWRTSRPGKPPGLNYQDNAIVDRGGFMPSRGVAHASEGEWKALPHLLEHLPLPPVSLAADTAYNAARLRQILEERGITAYIPIHPRQESNMVARGALSTGETMWPVPRARC